MIDDHGSAVSPKKVCEYHHTISGSDHLLSIGRSDVNAAVECTLSVERINELAESTGYAAFHRPEVWRGVCAQPVRSGHIACHTERDAGRRGAAQGSRPQRV